MTGRRARRWSRRSGFTLVELAVTVMIVGILAGLALPNLRQALLKADAAHLIADAHTVSLAAYEYLNDNGSFPVSSVQLATYLPDGFELSYKNVSYTWFGITLPNANNTWHSRNLGILMLNYSTRPEMAGPMKSFQGGDAYWSASYFYFIWAG